WEHEPAIDLALMERVDIATPHIAGYSQDGKRRGTEMIWQGFCETFGLPLVAPAATEGDVTLVLDAGEKRATVAGAAALEPGENRAQVVDAAALEQRENRAQVIDAAALEQRENR